MDENDYGKLVWSDDESKSFGIWKTALLFLTVIFVMNSIITFSWVYPVLAFLFAICYMYLASQPDRMTVRAKVYEKGIIGSFYPQQKGGLSVPKEMFFDWKRIKNLRVEKKGTLSKTNWLYISFDDCTYALKLENRESFISCCRKQNIKVLIE